MDPIVINQSILRLPDLISRAECWLASQVFIFFLKEGGFVFKKEKCNKSDGKRL